MIILTDIIGILVIITLAYHGYKNFENLAKSFIVPSFLSVIIFYKVFPYIYDFILSYITQKIIAGLFVVLAVNLPLIIVFHFLIKIVVLNFEKKFFLPHVAAYIKKFFGGLMGILIGYIFVTGSIVALQNYLAYRHASVTILHKSLFYRFSTSNKPEVVDLYKVDNLPALKELYSEENVAKFNIDKDELIAILKIIRGISNQNAQTLLKQIEEHQDTQKIYCNLITLYNEEVSVVEKYKVPEEIIEHIMGKFCSV